MFNFLNFSLNEINIIANNDISIIIIKMEITIIYNEVEPFNNPVKLKFRKKLKIFIINLF